MKIQNRQKGNQGEEEATKYLQKNGWEILDRNFQTRWGEVDIIAKKGSIVSFIEVKTKSSDQFGSPEQMINRNKIFQIQKTADMFLLKNKKLTSDFETFRLDMIAVVLVNNKVERLDFYENVGAEFI